MSECYFQVTIQQHVMIQNIADDLLAEGIFLNALGNISFWTTLWIIAFSLQYGYTSNIRSICPDILHGFKFFINKVKSLWNRVTKCLSVEVKLFDFHRQTLDRSGLLFKSSVSRYLFLLKYLFLISSVECFSYSPGVFFIISAVLLHAQAPLIKTFCKLV